MLVDSPSLVVTEITEDQLGSLECPVSVVVRDVDSRVAESDYVSSFVTGQVRNETRMSVDHPPLSVSEVSGSVSDGTKSTVPFVQRDGYSISAKTDDVDLPVTSQVCDEAGVLIDAPATYTAAELVDDALGGRESSIPVVATNVNPDLAESYDVWTAISSGVTEKAQVALEAPTRVVAEVGSRDVGLIEFRIAIVPGDNDSAVPKSNNVASSGVSNVG